MPSPIRASPTLKGSGSSAAGADIASGTEHSRTACERPAPAVGSARPARSVWRRLMKHKSGRIGGVIITAMLCAGLVGPVLAQDPSKTDLKHTLIAPDRTHLLGTDQVGRDILSRILLGARLSLVIGAVVVAIAVTVGAPLGLIAAYFKGTTDFTVMRVTDLALAFPALLLALIVINILGPGILQTMIAVGVAQIPRFVRIARAGALAAVEREFILAARSIGEGDWRIIRLHVLPNSLAPVIIEATVLFATSILIAASLSFLGLGVRPPTPEWGNMLSEGRDYMSAAPHIVAFPGLSILIAVLGFNLLGDGLRDALDVKFRV